MPLMGGISVVAPAALARARSPATSSDAPYTVIQPGPSGALPMPGLPSAWSTMPYSISGICWNSQPKSPP